MNPYSYAIQGLGGMPQDYSSIKHPLTDALTDIQRYSNCIHDRSNLQRAISDLEKAMKEERYSERTKAFVQGHGWSKLADLIFKDAYFVNDPLGLVPFLKFIATIAALYPNDKVLPTDGIHSTNIIEKLTDATDFLCSEIRKRETDATEEEEQYFESLAKFFEAYIKSFEHGYDVARTMVNSVVGALIEQHNAHVLAFLPAWEILCKNRHSGAYSAINRLLNDMVRVANEQYNRVKNLDPTEHPIYKEKWMKGATDLINEKRFSTDVKAHRFEFSQTETSVGNLNVSFMYNDEQREMYHKQEEFNIRLHTIKATKLAAFDKNGLSDPYVTFGHSEHASFKTKTIKKTLNPEWIFELKDKAAFTVPQHFSSLEVTIIDWDLIGKNEKMCEFSVDFGVLRALFMSATANQSERFTLVLRSPNTVKKGDNYLTGMHGELTIVFSFERYAPLK